MGLEQMNLNWSAEIIRVLKPSAVVCGRFQTHRFLWQRLMPVDCHFSGAGSGSAAGL